MSITDTDYPRATPSGYYRRDDDFHRTQVVVNRRMVPGTGEADLFTPECLSCEWQGKTTTEWEEARAAELVHHYYELEEDDEQ